MIRGWYEVDTRMIPPPPLKLANVNRTGYEEVKSQINTFADIAVCWNRLSPSRLLIPIIPLWCGCPGGCASKPHRQASPPCPRKQSMLIDFETLYIQRANSIHTIRKLYTYNSQTLYIQFHNRHKNKTKTGTKNTNYEDKNRTSSHWEARWYTVIKTLIL